jgi:leader peptidase (prepilin peptidase)/N-methyltransferase
MFPLLGLGFYAATTIPLMVIDLRERRLPNKITIPGFLISLLGLTLTFEWQRVLVVLAVSIVVFGVGTGLSMAGWIGMGDVKLVAGLSLLLAWFDYGLLWQATLWAFGLATAVVLAGYLAKKITARSTIALGPYLLMGFWVAIGPYVLRAISFDGLIEQ